MSATRHELHYGDRVRRCFPDRPPNVDAVLKDAAASNPQGVALVLGSTRVSYAELDGVVEVVAGNLAARGFAAGDRLALLIGNRLEFAYVVLAAARLGVFSLPLKPPQPRPQTQFTLNTHSHHTYIIT